MKTRPSSLSPPLNTPQRQRYTQGHTTLSRRKGARAREGAAASVGVDWPRVVSRQP